jgi:hypothetical protein
MSAMVRKDATLSKNENVRVGAGSHFLFDTTHHSRHVVDETFRWHLVERERFKGILVALYHKAGQPMNQKQRTRFTRLILISIPTPRTILECPWAFHDYGGHYPN